MAKKKKDDINKWPIPAFMLIGLGIGFLLMDQFPLAIPAFLLIGLGIGFLVSIALTKKK